MHPSNRRIVLSSILAGLAAIAVAAQQMPPMKPGLWESRSTMLDENGKEMVPPELAALANMPPEARARMAEMMKGRGVQMPDPSGAMKVCMTKEMTNAASMQELANAQGCSTTYSTQTASKWVWHSTCAALKSESDGEALFTNAENYKVTLKSTMNVNGKTVTQTRIVTSKWVAADCGDVKPIDMSQFMNGGRGAGGRGGAGR